MKMFLSAVALTIAAPAALANPGHAGHATAPADKTAAKGASKTHPAGCHMMDGKLVRMKDGKMVPCPAGQAKQKPAADPHAGHDMSKR